MKKGPASVRFVDSCWRKPSLQQIPADISPANFFSLVGIWIAVPSSLLCFVILLHVCG